MVHTAFQTTMDRETERSIEEMKIFQYALVASLEGLPKGYQATDMAVSEIARSIQQSLNNAQGGVVIYNKDNKVIYQNSSYQGDLIRTSREGKSGAWRIHKQEDHYYLESLCEIRSSVGSYVLENHQNIDHVYQDRDQLYDTYLLALALVSAVFAVVLLVFSMHFTRPVRKLSQATRSFANGNYKSRVKEKGHDEVAILGHDFNQMAGQLEENIRQLEEDARRQEEFTGAFSHELKTPLTSIIGYADMLRSMELSEEEIFLSADYIFNQGKRLERLALKMMELSYIDKQEIAFQRVDVNFLANQIKAMTERMLQAKRVELTVRVEEGTIFGDPDLLLSLFSNLIDNARKACDEGGGITLEGHRLEEGYRFCLKDNGHGMPEEEIYKITEPFYMVDKSRARKEGGAGMGMSLCQKIIQLHHAEWNIRSRIGEGTEIRIRFPDCQTAVNDGQEEGARDEKRI